MNTIELYKKKYGFDKPLAKIVEDYLSNKEIDDYGDIRISNADIEEISKLINNYLIELSTKIYEVLDALTMKLK